MVFCRNLDFEEENATEQNFVCIERDEKGKRCREKGFKLTTQIINMYELAFSICFGMVWYSVCVHFYFPTTTQAFFCVLITWHYHTPIDVANLLRSYYINK